MSSYNTHFVFIKLQHKLENLGQLFDQRLLRLKMLCGIKAAADQLAQELRHYSLELE